MHQPDLTIPLRQSVPATSGVPDAGVATRDSHVPVNNGFRDRGDGYVDIDGECWSRISDSHAMPEFFMCPVSSSDHWMFVSSEGALTAGRKSPDFALFPYYSSDKLIDAADSTGPRTVVRMAADDGRHVLWEPFARRTATEQLISRNLYKSFLGDRIRFEEVNHTLGLSFRYEWAFGNRFGFIRSCQLTTLAPGSRKVCVLDGLQNLMSYGLDQNFQLRYSNLGNAYKKGELLSKSRLGLFYLSSIPTDRAEPSEGLQATVAWSVGLDRPTVLLSSQQLDAFRSGSFLSDEVDVRGQPSSYFVATEFELGERTSNSIAWRIVANVCQDHAEIVDLNRQILEGSEIEATIEQDLSDNRRRLLELVSSADGRQMGANRRRLQRHQSNVLFNAMRGGIPRRGYTVCGREFRDHVQHSNRRVAERNRQLLEGLEDVMNLKDLLARTDQGGDRDLQRIALEYLPLTFSRRHGDPTRPWNAFSINFLNPDGSEQLCYEGNWRDIFQNWEALSLAFPDLCCSMVFRFVNASTADGYNPYRITSDGFDWETIDADDPWANIGYWGDHQIIYLLKLLEWSRRFEPGRLNRWLSDECCVYAQIPYRIGSYADICRNPRDTITFDDELAEAILRRVEAVGADGKLLPGPNGSPCHVTLAEKLLVPALVKITNFVPGGGVWLNTQRPEWNDANNALVGNGLSMVTTCYLRRFFAFMTDWFCEEGLPARLAVSSEVAALLRRVAQVLTAHADSFGGVIDDRQRKEIVDALAHAGSDYREGLYREGLSGTKVELETAECVAVFRQCLLMLDQTIRSNRCPDGLYHSYNLIRLSDESYSIQPLQEMLEGQVAVLSSRLLSPEEAADVLDALRDSAIYREDQQSYMLYPDRELPRFLEKNVVAETSWRRSRLLRHLLDANDASVVRRDVEGGVHFCGDFRNISDLRRALDRLGEQADYAALVRDEQPLIEEIFEQAFRHHRFTGRSGTFFAYEGLGSIYWHMVSKLCLAALENWIWAGDSCAPDVHRRLRKHYRDIRDGLGLTKSPQQYGAFPSDPYSHTPTGAGVQQPGMTGQVKEDILCRMAELGMRVSRGILRFDLSLFESSELLDVDGSLDYFDVDNRWQCLPLSAGSFAYTICQVPVIYHRSAEQKLVVNFRDRPPVHRERLHLTESETEDLFERNGQTDSIHVYFDPGAGH